MADTKTKAGTRFIDARRRGFLQGAVVAGGAAASGVTLAHESPEHDLPATGPAKPTGSGYRETDHVREYYAKARY